jgi:uncharacterized membrane protein YdbT with pleckstrin-like domain
MKRQHPIAIFRLITKNFWLLIFPLIRGLAALRFDFYTWVQGAYFDIIIIVVILVSAIERWYFTKFEIGEKEFLYESGFFFKIKYSVPYAVLSAVTTERMFLIRPFRAVKIFLDSDGIAFGASAKAADVKITTTLKDSEKLFRMIQKETTKATVKYKVSGPGWMFFSLVFSSALSGAVFLITFFMQGGKIVGNRLEQTFYTAVNDMTKLAGTIIKGVSPAMVAISIIIAGGWFISFVRNLLRHDNFTIARKGNNITITNGFLTKRKYYINTDKVNYADLRQSLFMKLCRVMSVHVNCSGYGKAKNEIPVFVPISRYENICGTMKMVLPSFILSDNEIYAHTNALFRFLWPPAALIFIFLVMSLIAVVFFPAWSIFILFLAIMSEIPSVTLLIVKLVAFYTNGISFKNNVVCLRYCTKFQYHTVIVPKTRIAKVTIRQSFFQRLNCTCDVIINTNSEYTKSHRVRGMTLCDAVKLIKSAGISELTQ